MYISLGFSILSIIVFWLLSNRCFFSNNTLTFIFIQALWRFYSFSTICSLFLLFGLIFRLILSKIYACVFDIYHRLIKRTWSQCFLWFFIFLGIHFILFLFLKIVALAIIIVTYLNHLLKTRIGLPLLLLRSLQLHK